MRTLEKQYDFVVVGGGMTGTIAAIAAARHGAKTALIQDRPVLGGNASSEVRMHICGAHGPNNRETGILEELFLENHFRNRQPNYSIWDSVVYGKAVYQEGLDVYLNASVCDARMDGDRLASVTAWQLTTETWWTISANVFADCSGDGILAPLTGAEFRFGREARDEYGESIAPEQGDAKTMGLSCLFQAREYPEPRPFTAPEWACDFRKPEDLNGRGVDLRRTNFWWLEVGGDRDSIHDTEELRRELLEIALGVWNYLKNHAPNKDEFANWELDWQGFLPGKRESRRYVGDHVLTQHDIESGGNVPDLVAYGGWTMDDHFPAGFHHPEKGTTHYPTPSPYGIPYRTLYSRNVRNLFCAGRIHSATHVAMSSTRVMATCSLMGQAAGTAAAIAVRERTTPRGVYEHHLEELRRTLQSDDVWLPFTERAVTRETLAASPAGPGEALELLRDGHDRPDEESYHGWVGPVGEPITLSWDHPQKLTALRLIFDSDLDRLDPVRGPGFRARNMRHFYALDAPPWSMPGTMIRSFNVSVETEDGRRTDVATVEDNHRRLVRVALPADRPVGSVTVTPLATWGDAQARIFSIDAES